MSKCTAAIRPASEPDIEFRCEYDHDTDEVPLGPSTQHVAIARDFAYPGSATKIKWFEIDRRNFHGEYPGRCSEKCALPLNHKGQCT